MTTQISFPNRLEEIEIIAVSTRMSGYGHQEIKVTIYHDGATKQFSAVTNCMPDYDRANELEGEERYEAFYNLIESAIEDEVRYWIDTKE